MDGMRSGGCCIEQEKEEEERKQKVKIKEGPFRAVSVGLRTVRILYDYCSDSVGRDKAGWAAGGRGITALSSPGTTFNATHAWGAAGSASAAAHTLTHETL